MEIVDFLDVSNANNLYSFIKPPFVGSYLFWILSYIILCLSFVSYRKSYKESITKYFRKYSIWLKYLLITGIVSIIIAMIFNDNDIMYTPLYPTAAITQTMRYGSLASIILSAGIIVSSEKRWHYVSKFCLSIIVGVGITGIITAGLDLTARYGDEKGLMLAPICSAFIPCLLLWDYKGNNNLFSFLFLPLTFITISIFYPNIIGSKWFFVIGASFMCLFIKAFHIRSIFLISIIGIVALIFIPYVSELILPLLTGDFTIWKFTRMMDFLNVFSFNSFEEWFNTIGDSPKFRIDEFINISIEYWHKPFYFLFGKGFGGTTLHHNNLLYWEQMGAHNFSDEQIINGFYYAMHETTGVIYLRHGLFGLVFMYTTIVSLIKRVSSSAWALIGIIWFIFYWNYAQSLLLGGVAISLALMKETYKESY